MCRALLISFQVYPVAYLEFVRNEDGSMTKFGPRNEKEELKAQDLWLVSVSILLCRAVLMPGIDEEGERDGEDPHNP